MRYFAIALIAFGFLSGCDSTQKKSSEKTQVIEQTTKNLDKPINKLATVFSEKGTKIPNEKYALLGIENQFGDLFTDTIYTTKQGHQLCVFSDLPSGCTDFYCYANYYVALVSNNTCKSLKATSITLGSKPSVEYLENTYVCISNEVEQYSSEEGSHAASITDDIVDFKKSFMVLDGKLVEVEP